MALRPPAFAGCAFVGSGGVRPEIRHGTEVVNPTALAILQRLHPELGVERTSVEEVRPSFHCRHLERMALGTSYPAVASHVAGLLNSPRLKGRTSLVVDATGVGRPVVDMLRQRGLNPTAITITGGDIVTFEGGSWRVPKRDLVSIVAVALQTDRLKFAKELPAVPVMVQELLNFRVKIDPLTAHDSYGAWREGQHDDYVLALACALWFGERWRPPTLSIPSTSYSSWP